MKQRYNRPSDIHNAGFSLAELLAVISILALLAVISVPAFLSQKRKTTAATQQIDISGVNTEVQSLLTQWKGKPSAQVDLSTTSGTWNAHKVGDGATTYVASGKVTTADTTITGTVWTNGSYCIQSTNTEGNNYTYRSDTKTTAEGSCPSSALAGAASITAAVPSNVPVAPTFSSLVGGTNSIVATWAAVTGANAYNLVLDQGSPIPIEGGTLTYTFSQVQPGEHTVYVRAVNTNGSSSATGSKVTVTGNNLLGGNYEISGTLVKDKVWTPITFASGWTAYTPATFGTPSYRLYPDGTVRLIGQTNHVASMTAGSYTILTLPAGYRPTVKQTYTVFGKLSSGSASTPMQVDVATTGIVSVTLLSTASIDWLSLTPITFSVD